MNFNAKKVKDDIVEWIRDWFEANGKYCNAIIGVSGGKDSSVVAGLLVEALGKDRVIGVLMPQNTQYDILYSHDLVNYLEIQSYTINIGGVVEELLDNLSINTDLPISQQTQINLPPRIRMSTLYAVAQSTNGRVIGTTNLSENYIGYFTRWGDGVSDCEPLAGLTATEVIELGKELRLPSHLIEKVPSDGLCGKTDEERFGFTYEVLDKYIRTGICEDETVRDKIDDMHNKNLFKLLPLPSYSLREANLCI